MMKQTWIAFVALLLLLGCGAESGRPAEGDGIGHPFDSTWVPMDPGKTYTYRADPDHPGKWQLDSAVIGEVAGSAGDVAEADAPEGAESNEMGNASEQGRRRAVAVQFASGSSKYVQTEIVNLYRWWRDTLSESARKRIENRELPVYIIGHAQGSGSFDREMKLSGDRANGVLKELRNWVPGGELDARLASWGSHGVDSSLGGTGIAAKLGDRVEVWVTY